MEAKKNAEIAVYENNIKYTDTKSLCRFNKLCKAFESKGISMRRYSFDEDREPFRQNKDLWHLICCAGREVLPATYVNGKIEKIEEYPTKKEVYNWLSNV